MTTTKAAIELPTYLAVELLPRTDPKTVAEALIRGGKKAGTWFRRLECLGLTDIAMRKFVRFRTDLADPMPVLRLMLERGLAVVYLTEGGYEVQFPPRKGRVGTLQMTLPTGEAVAYKGPKIKGWQRAFETPLFFYGGAWGMKVALVQFAPRFKAVEANLRRLVAFVQQAASEGARLIVLPELATTGYSFMSAREARPFAEPVTEQGRTFQVMRALARKLGVHIVWGMVEVDPVTNTLHNAQVLVTPTGPWVRYAKVNLWGNDWLWAAEGRANPPILACDFGVDGVRRVGLLICRDVRDKKNDKWSDFYESGDADLVCLSANWGDGGFPSISWIDFVKDNATTLLVSNRWGKEVPNDFGEGGVCAITAKPFGIQCEGLVWNADCVVYAKV
jgi:predicted amidohydrolase